MEVDNQQDGDDDATALDSSKMMDDSSYMPTQPLGDLMSPPPEGGSYPTLEAVQKAVLKYCTSVGYAIVIGRSKKTVPGLKKVLFVCDRAGKPPNRVSPEFRKRKTSSRKCDCPFGFFAIEQRTQWTIRYRPDRAHLQHNHGPSEGPSNHPAARKLSSEMVTAVKHLKESGKDQPKPQPQFARNADSQVAGAGVSETLAILQNDNPDCHLIPRDIYNARAAINRNPQKTSTGMTETQPTIYTKQVTSSEDRIRAELRRELSKAREDLKKVEEEKQKEIDQLKLEIEEKDKQIKRFEMFIDICNQRVMVQRERLLDGNPAPGNNSSA
ncbi:unnamed protein product [Clonostachys rosea]|uniref:FAR1 domain-containing protein n=1 Tax=Bionectria ochroleuca TaxID=29856 RepID=A0ABY6TT39_BIOOC|nr:unnamed protein product [Clonostachys rosea]